MNWLCRIGLHGWTYKKDNWIKHNRVCVRCGLYEYGVWSMADNRTIEKKYVDDPRALSAHWINEKREWRKTSKRLEAERRQRTKETLIPWQNLK